MLRNKNKELERLEQALLEDEEDEEAYEEEEYGDEADHEEEYEQPSPRTGGISCLSVLALMLMTAIVFVLMLFALKIKGIF